MPVTFTIDRHRRLLIARASGVLVDDAGKESDALEASLRRALDREEMTLHYQPCLELATGRVVGMEALLRWQRPELGILEPKDFIALADFTGVMLSVGPWVLETGCRQVREWQRRGSWGLRVMINLSAHELQQPELVVHVEKALDEIRKNRETLYDPLVADVCLALFEVKGYRLEEKAGEFPD